MNKKLGAFALPAALGPRARGLLRRRRQRVRPPTPRVRPRRRQGPGHHVLGHGRRHPRGRCATTSSREYKDATGGTLTIEEQCWGDALTKLANQLPDANNTPDVTEIGNTWAPTFTTAGAFSDLSAIYDDLGGSDLLESFVEVGSVDGAQYALPYYFGSRYITYRKDIWEAAGLVGPDHARAVQRGRQAAQDGRPGRLLHRRPGLAQRHLVDLRQRRRPRQEGRRQVGLDALRPDAITGLEQFQDLFVNASTAPVTEADSTPWVNINNDKDGTPPTAATIIAPGWAHWSVGDYIGDKTNDDGTTTEVREWNDDTFGVFPLPGVEAGRSPRSSPAARTSASRPRARTRPAPRSSCASSSPTSTSRCSARTASARRTPSTSLAR